MDLYYRLRGLVLHIPPLRDRQEAIRPMAQYFLTTYCREHGLQEKTFTDSALDILRQQQWPGNVRELKHIVESAAIFSGTPSIDHLQVLSVLHMFAESADSPPEELGKDASLHDSTLTFEKRRILEALSETGGNITHAATKLNVDRATLSKKMKRLGLR
jgi:DNA-binding NtrC family response regulator